MKATTPMRKRSLTTLTLAALITLGAPAAAATAAATPSGTPSADPDLTTMNQAHDHTMGSTIREYDPAAAASTTATPNTAGPLKASAATVTPSAATAPGLPGLDVSGWQTGINWGQVAANGAQFAYVKATESTDYTSSQFSSQYNGSYAAGLTRGAYHFAVPNVSSGATQARYFVANGGGWSADGRTLPPLLDIEYNPYTSTDHTNTCYGLTAAAMVSWIGDFSRTVQQLTGKLPAIYSTTNWWSTCTGDTPAFGANPLFIARYPASVSDGAGTLPAGWSAYTMWQWADSGVFPGDQDVFAGNAAALHQLAVSSATIASTPAMAQPVIGISDLNGDGKPDLLACKPDGTLWFYAGTGGGYAAGVQIGSGWSVFDELVAAGDVNGDGKPDLLARKPDGTLWLYPGTGVVGALSVANPGLGTGIQIGSGWTIFTDIIAAGDVNGDHKPDLLGRKPDGTLWLYAGTGHVDGTSNGYLAGTLAGSGWTIFTQVLGAGDINGDGRDDLLGIRPDGSLWYYRGAAAGYQAGTRISAPGLNPGDLLIAGGDVNGDSKPDLLTRTAGGALNLFADGSVAQAAYGAAQTVGSGWTIFNHVIGAGDLNGDGKPDIIATTPDGTLYLYAGNGSANGVNHSYQNGVKVGSGWSIFTKVINGGDFTGDGRPDLVAVHTDGSLWLYPSTGVVNPTKPSTYLNGIRIGSGGWGAFSQIVAGDFTGDGVPDILATRPDGTMFLYPGVRQTPSSTSWFGAPTAVSNGWNQYTAIDSTGDSNGDGKADIVAQKPDGTLWFYPGNGAMGPGNSGLGNPSIVGSGWTIFSSVTGTGDTNGGRTGDLLGIRPDGALVYYPATGLAGIPAPAFASATAIGSGWNIFG